MSPDILCTVQGVQGSVLGDRGSARGSVRGVLYGCAPSTKSWARGREWRSAAKDGQNHWASWNLHNHDNDEKYLIQKLLTDKYDQLREAEFSKQKKQNTMEACLMFQPQR